jgi:hypothetical protein
MKQELLTVAEVARAVDPPLTPAGIRAAVATGRIRVTVRTRSGVKLFDLAAVREFQAERSRRLAARKVA